MASTLDGHLPLAGDLSLTFIGRPRPGAGQPSALCPSQSFSLVRLKKRKETKPTHTKKEERKEKETKKKVLDHSVNLRPRQLGSSGLGRLPPGAPNLTEVPRKSGLPGASFQKSHKTENKNLFSVCAIPMVRGLASS